jgi:hypothetical protein
MWSGSPRDQVLGGVIAVATMSFLFGMFLMHGIQRLLAHDSTYILMFLLLPLFVFAAVLNVRRILKAVP